MADELENADSQNGEGEGDELDLDIDETETDPEALKNRAKEISEASKKILDKNKKLFHRAKKAEGFELKDGKWVKTDKPAPKQDPVTPPLKVPDLSPQDTIALAKADVADEDMDEILAHAKFKGITVREALKTNYIKSYMAEQAEFRKTAAAANTGGGKRVTTKVTPDTLLKDLSEGKVPEKGSKEAEDLFWAKHGGRR